MSVALLRAETAAAHEIVDAAFGRHDLSAPADYRSFLIAHARALPAAEARMQSLDLARTLAPRTPLLIADLTALNASPPASLPLAAGDEATAWGTLYVVEGSRLGGALLARQVPAGWPRAYLAAVHPPGQWRAIRTAIDDAATGRDAAWHRRMIDGALETFDLYARAANG